MVNASTIQDMFVLLIADYPSVEYLTALSPFTCIFLLHANYVQYSYKDCNHLSVDQNFLQLTERVMYTGFKCAHKKQTTTTNNLLHP
jgi:hypothetical protein